MRLCSGDAEDPVDEDYLICCRKHAIKWAKERAVAEQYPFVVWWVMRHDAYLVEAEGMRPSLRHVTKEEIVKPR